jgi:hypothetical protein
MLLAQEMLIAPLVTQCPLAFQASGPARARGKVDLRLLPRLILPNKS